MSSSQQVILYHYSSQRYDTLKTRAAQGKPVLPDRDLISTVGTYNDHVSFFIEAPPLDIMGAIYGKDHGTWFPGSKLIEHRVDLSKLKSFKYHFVETPEKIKMLFDDSVSDEEYYEKLEKINKSKGYTGKNLKEFRLPYNALKGSTRYHVMRANTFPKWDVNRFKYAACVPHVMIYPQGGVIPVMDTREVVVST